MQEVEGPLPFRWMLPSFMVGSGCPVCIVAGPWDSGKGFFESPTIYATCVGFDVEPLETGRDPCGFALSS